MDNEREYEVGKGKPPRASQFKPGQSGNPAGARRHKRRKSGFTLRELAIACANEIMTITHQWAEVQGHQEGSTVHLGV
jgi:hypothetical protein